MKKLFWNSDLKIYFKTETTVGKFINNNKDINPNKFYKRGFFQLTSKVVI